MDVFSLLLECYFSGIFRDVYDGGADGHASSSTERVPIEARRRYASSGTEQVPLEAYRLCASSGTE